MKIKLKNPLKNKYSNLYLDSVVSQVKPLSPRSVLVVGKSPQLINKLKKIKYSSMETTDFSDKLAFKSGSFDLVICIDRLTNGNRKLYKEALRVSKKYVYVSWNINFISIIGQDQILKIIKVKGVKILSKKLVLNKYLAVVRKQI